MNEQEWLSATGGLWLMEAADGHSIRKLGSVAWRSVAARVACLARLGAEMPPGVRQWAAHATDYLDREDRLEFADDVLFDGRDQVYDAFRESYDQVGPELRQRLAAAQDVFRGRDYYAEDGYMLEEDESSLTYTGPVYAAEAAAHCNIIRDIFGNPFRPVAFDAAWRTSTAVALARGMYESRDFGAMPILADALQDAGCDSDDVLSHCRDPQQVHVRGCWVVDLVLGKG